MLYYFALHCIALQCNALHCWVCIHFFCWSMIEWVANVDRQFSMWPGGVRWSRSPKNDSSTCRTPFANLDTASSRLSWVNRQRGIAVLVLWWDAACQYTAFNFNVYNGIGLLATQFISKYKATLLSHQIFDNAALTVVRQRRRSLHGREPPPPLKCLITSSTAHVILAKNTFIAFASCLLHVRWMFTELAPRRTWNDANHGCYYFSHSTESTQWDHPEMGRLMQSLGRLPLLCRVYLIPTLRVMTK